MNNKPTPQGPPTPAGGRASPLDQVGYLGLAHFLRATGHVAQAAQLIEQQRHRPDAAAIGQAMARFAKVTPNAQGPALADYFLALAERKLQLRGVTVDPLVMYMLHNELVKRAEEA